MDKFQSRMLELRNLYIQPTLPKTKMSKGELLIYKILKKHNFIFDYQYRNKTLRHKSFLSIDFLVYYKNKKTAIEFNGIQHYIQVSMFEDLRIIQARDNSKFIWCKKNDINLLVIKYNQIKQVEGIVLDYFLNG